MINLNETSVSVPDRGVEGMPSLEQFVETIRPWIDQAHINFIVCDPDMIMVYINPFAINGLRGLIEDMKPYCKAARELTHIKDVVGMDTEVFHRHPDIKELMLKKDGNYEKTFRLATHLFRGKCRAIRDAKGEIIGWIDSWDVMGRGKGESEVNADEIMLYGKASINIDTET